MPWRSDKMGMRDGSFSYFSKENGNEGRFLFPLFYEKWEKEPSLIPIFAPKASFPIPIFILPLTFGR